MTQQKEKQSKKNNSSDVFNYDNVVACVQVVRVQNVRLNHREDEKQNVIQLLKEYFELKSNRHVSNAV